MLAPPRSPGLFAHRVKGVKSERSDPLTHASIMGRAGEANGGGVFRPEGIRRAGRVRADASRGLALRLPASIARPVAAAIGGVLLLATAVW